MRKSKIEKHEDGSATILTKNVQDGVAYYYAQEIWDGGQGDVYDISEEEYLKNDTATVIVGGNVPR